MDLPVRGRVTPPSVTPQQRAAASAARTHGAARSRANTQPLPGSPVPSVRPAMRVAAGASGSFGLEIRRRPPRRARSPAISDQDAVPQDAPRVPGRPGLAPPGDVHAGGWPAGACAAQLRGCGVHALCSEGGADAQPRGYL